MAVQEESIPALGNAVQHVLVIQFLFAGARIVFDGDARNEQMLPRRSQLISPWYLVFVFVVFVFFVFVVASEPHVHQQRTQFMQTWEKSQKTCTDNTCKSNPGPRAYASVLPDTASASPPARATARRSGNETA